MGEAAHEALLARERIAHALHAVLDLHGHEVEVLGERPYLIVASHLRARRKVAAGDVMRCLGELRERARERECSNERECRTARDQDDERQAKRRQLLVTCCHERGYVVSELELHGLLPDAAGATHDDEAYLALLVDHRQLGMSRLERRCLSAWKRGMLCQVAVPVIIDDRAVARHLDGRPGARSGQAQLGEHVGDVATRVDFAEASHDREHVDKRLVGIAHARLLARERPLKR